ncbi:MAG: hypothetical protein OEM23_07015 [Gemmatimonadota bacterium]|nr:hypothetical protein [Gemmatimonadota bacterium]
MIASIPTLLAGAVAQHALDRTGNMLSNTFRTLSRMINGHETLVLVIFAMLVLMYLYIRKT